MSAPGSPQTQPNIYQTFTAVFKLDHELLEIDGLTMFGMLNP